MKLSLFIRITIISILMIVPIVQASAQTQRRDGQTPDNRPRTASLGGRITIAGKAAANAKVIVTEVKDRTVLGNQAMSLDVGVLNPGEDYSVLTDADGRYRVTSLPEGKYEVRALLGGCVREQQSPNGAMSETATLDEGESRENLDFMLVRGGVITGRVTDADGRPLISRTVNLQVIDDQGQKQEVHSMQNLLMMSEMFQTDDRGVYRIFALRPGRYVLSAGGDSGIMGMVTGASGNYPRVWHPDATDENQAKVLAVTSGGEITGVDIRLGAAKKTYEALGRVVDEETGKPVAGAGVMCIKVKGPGEDEAVAFGLGGFGGNSKTDGQGNFRVNGLAPGRYRVSLSDYESFLTGGGKGYYSDGVMFEIQGGDATNIEIKAKNGATISGVAVIEDADPSAKSSLSQTMIMAQARPAAPPSPDEAKEDGIGFDMTPAISRIGSDGGFSLKGLRPGKVTIQAFSVTPGGLKIMRIERGGAELSDGIEIRAGREEISGVRIVLGKGAGVIRGQVSVTGGALPEGWRMTVMAHSEKSAGDLGGPSGYAQVDSKGRFVIEGLLPGEYQLMLMAQPEIRPNFTPPPGGSMPAPVTQKVIVTKGQEAQVTMTLDLSKKAQEDKQ